VSAVLDHRVAAPATGVRFGALVVVADGPQRRAMTERLATLGALHVGEAASVAEARVRARGLTMRDLVVAEARLPDGSGAGLLAELLRSGWGRAVALSNDADPFSVRAVLAAGARGLVVRSTTPALASTAPPGGLRGISERELEVLQLVASGRSNRDVAEALNLSALTVKSHLARIGRKIGTGDRAEMVMHALRAGLIR
jgi:DNA-binding NarL/FixJ family response regulator